MNDNSPTNKERKRTNWSMLVFLALVTYVLSSGPMLGLGFWLREATGWGGFYAVMWLYYPLLCWGHHEPLTSYVDWWVVDVFHTVGPG